jgi:hypothetical protein
MTEDLYKLQAQRARDLAEKADPFIKRRLLELAASYDAKVAKRPRSMAPLLSLPPDLTAVSEKSREP